MPLLNYTAAGREGFEAGSSGCAMNLDIWAKLFLGSRRGRLKAGEVFNAKFAIGPMILGS